MEEKRQKVALEVGLRISSLVDSERDSHTNP